MISAERRGKLAQILISEGSIKITEFADIFHVSTETIRKDIEYLEQKGIAQKSHGGAIAKNQTLERPLTARMLKNADAKSKIAQAAMEFIQPNAVIILDSGSTTLNIAKILTLRDDITVVTNSISIMQLLSYTDINLYSLGGKTRPNSDALAGPWTKEALNSIKADLVFLGTNGFHQRTGPCSSSFFEADIKKAMIQNSRKAILVSDSSKFYSDAIFQYCNWSDIDCLVTDSQAPKEDLQQLENQVKIKIVETDNMSISACRQKAKNASEIKE